MVCVRMKKVKRVRQACGGGRSTATSSRAGTQVTCLEETPVAFS